MNKKALYIVFICCTLLMGCSAEKSAAIKIQTDKPNDSIKTEYKTEVQISSDTIISDKKSGETSQKNVEPSTELNNEEKNNVHESNSLSSNGNGSNKKAIVTEESKRVEKTEVEKEDVVNVQTVPVKPDVQSTDLFLPIENSKERTENITHLMIHFISNAGKNPKDPYNVNDVNSIFLDYGLSVHYMIDRSGKIYQLVSEDRVAYHAGKGSLTDFPEYENRMNEYSIGIELLAIGTKEEMKDLISDSTFNQIDPALLGYTDSQYHSLKLLVDDILKRNSKILYDRRHVIGHDEYAPGRKTDPGKLFDWTRIGF